MTFTTTTTTTTTTLYRNTTPRYHTLPPPTPTADIPPGARRTPLQIGLQIDATPHSSTQTTSTYDSHIMHRPIPPTLYDLTATTDVSIPALATAFNIPVAIVANHWLTSRSPMELPGYDRRLDDVAPAPHTRRYTPVPPTVVEKHRQLAAQVTRKLEHYVQSPHHATAHADTSTEEDCYSPPAREERVVHAERDTCAQRCVQPGGYRKNGVAHPQCGFSKLGTHAQLNLSVDRSVVRKWGHGLYRAALGSGAAKGAYAEFEVGSLGGEGGGVAVGVAPMGHALNRLAGSDGRSAGLHASGMIVTESGEWRKVCDRLEEGDVVGVAVGREVEFYVNGRFVGAVGMEVEMECLKFVACLYYVGAEVRLRCCKDEWEYYEAALKRVKDGLRASCFAVEDVEADMSSTSLASGSNDMLWKNEPSPVDKHGGKQVASCESVVTP